MTNTTKPRYGMKLFSRAARMIVTIKALIVTLMNVIVGGQLAATVE
jgi:hypothetical protein